MVREVFELANPLLNRVVNSPFGDSLIALLERGARPKPNQLRVLTYHRVLEPAAFQQQMAYLAAEHPVISMPQLLAACTNGNALPPGSVMITFDDAYDSFAECAWPIMKSYGLPATLFVPTAFPDNPRRIFWWDRLEHALTQTSRRDSLDTPVGRISLETEAHRMKAYRRLRDYVKTLPYSETLAWTHQICSELDAPEPEPSVLGWQTLRHLADEGVTIGAHTQSHRWLTQLSPEEAEAEVRGSLAEIEMKIGAALPIFAYPDGRFNEEVVEILKRAGIVLAFTTIRGANDIRHADWLRLRRINIGPQATPLTLRAWLLHASMPEFARRLLNGH